MKIIIEAEPKEVAALVLAVQERQEMTIMNHIYSDSLECPVPDMVANK